MVITYIDHSNNQIKKSSLESLSYAAAVAVQLGSHAEAVLIGEYSSDVSELGKYGATKVHHIQNDALNSFDAQVFSKVVADFVSSIGANVIIVPNNLTGKAIAPQLSVLLKAGFVSGAVALPDLANGFVVKKNVFSGKAFANISIQTDIKIISLNSNSFPINITDKVAEVVSVNASIPSKKVEIVSTKTLEGELPLSEAEIVVSGGRGLKGPENWGMITDLAKLLNAATACSRPVADTGWRPHHEHVGQTGLAIAPNLYIAIGISGAIQHLAGVNRSKTIVVINKDAEAPFFKAADYGIVGDAFEVVPKLIEALKK